MLRPRFFFCSIVGQMGVLGGRKEWNGRIFSDALTYVDRNGKILSQILTTLNSPIYNRSTLVADQNYLIRHKIDEMLNSGILRRSESPFSSPVCVQYRGDKIELAVDYSILNAHTIPAIIRFHRHSRFCCPSPKVNCSPRLF